MLARLFREPPAIGGGTAMALGAALLFLVFWGGVLAGRQSLVATDSLYADLPWSATPAAHAPANPIVADGALESLPWLLQVREAFAAGRLPLWNPRVMGGAPLLANDASAAFSPFTWLALPFAPARGMSLAMLARLWVAGLGMAVFLRTLRASGVASALGGVAYATSSFMVVWLAWPLSGVAALMPWLFAAFEWFLASGRAPALAGLGLVVCLQLLAGHAQSSLHLGLAFTAYALLRQPGWRRLAWVGAAAALGVVAAGIQVIPFLDGLSHSSLVADRASGGLGFAHLSPAAATSWLAPDLRGNPALDGRPGGSPNYNEATAYAGVGALVLAVIAVGRGWRGRGSPALALAVLAAGSLAAVYGLLSPLFGRLPGLATANNQRLVLVACFAVAALAGLGLDSVRAASRPRWPAWAAFLPLALVALAGVGVLLLGARVDDVLPGYRSLIGYWAAVAGLSLAAALGFAAGGGRLGAAGFCLLALCEGAVFAAPFNPRVAPADSPPASQAVDWLRSHAGDGRVAATGLVLIPDSATLYGLADARGYEILASPAYREYWSQADPGYSDRGLLVRFEQPSVIALAEAGVAYVVTPAGAQVPGTDIAYQGEGVTIASVPGFRPYAYTTDPAGQVEVLSRRAGSAELEVSAPGPTAVVLLESYDPGWSATVDGRAAPIQAHGILFQQVEVPAGRHRVVFTYFPVSVWWGAAASLAGLAGLLALSLGWRWKR